MTKKIEAKSSSSSSSTSSTSKAQPSKASPKASTSSSSKSSSSSSNSVSTPKEKKPVQKVPKLTVPNFDLPNNAIKNITDKIVKDAGDFIENRDIEKKVIEVCEKYAGLKKKTLDNPDEFIEKLKGLAVSYSKHVDFQESTLGGTVTKYRIRQGMLFLILKKAVKVAGHKWKEWFKENLNARELRSAQEYMKLAKKPIIMNYAVVGKDRLLKILRLNGNGSKEVDDPIGDFFKSKKLAFNAESDTDLDEFKFKVDIEINHSRLLEANINEIPKGMVEDLLKSGNQVTGLLIKELQFLKKDRGDLVAYMEAVINNGGKAAPVDNPKRKAESFTWAADRFLKAIDTALTSGDMFSYISAETLKQLKNKIAKIERQIPRN